MARVILEREDVVARLVDVFREYGYGGTTVARITARTGIGKGSLYHFFPEGKNAMAAAAIEHVRAWFEDNVYDGLRSGEDATRRLDDMLDTVEAYFLRGGRVCLVGAFALGDARDLFANAIAGYFADWRAALAQVFRECEAEDERCLAYAELVLARIQGALVLSRALDSEAAFTGEIERLRTEVKHYLAH